MVKKIKTVALSISFILVTFSYATAEWLLPDTGQDKCYTANGEIIDCDGAGQDGSYNELPEYNQPSYTKLDSSGNTLSADAAEWAMVQDNVTGLIWEVKTDSNKTDKKTWSDADTYARGLSLGGYSNWRLPTTKELTSIVNRGIVEPSVNITYFKNAQSDFYWSSEEVIPQSDSSLIGDPVWAVDFKGGIIDNKDKLTVECHVRAVRSDENLPGPAFIDNGDGTVTDISTRLMWKKASESQTWENASAYCEELTFPEENGYTDWRWPNINELQSLIDYTKNPSMDTSAFPDAEGFVNYWSSTSHAKSTNWGWWILSNGYSYRSQKTGGPRYVRPVRGPVAADEIFGFRHAILGLKVLAGLDESFLDMNGDRKTGLEDVIFVLRKVAGL